MDGRQTFGEESFGTLAREYAKGADAASNVAQTLAQLKDAFWESDAADSFREKVDRYSQLMNQFESRFAALSKHMADNQQKVDTEQGSQSIG